MKIKLDIEVNEKEIRRDPQWLATFLTGYLSQLAGYKVSNVDLVLDNGTFVEKFLLVVKTVTNCLHTNHIIVYILEEPVV